PTCGVLHPAARIRCPNDGTNLAAQPVVREAEVEATVECPTCDVRHPEGTAACPYCGRDLRAGVHTEPPRRPAPDERAAGGGAHVDPPSAALPPRGAPLPAPESLRVLTSLPSALEGRYRIVREIPAMAGQAEILLLESVPDSKSYVLKLYRTGLELKR